MYWAPGAGHGPHHIFKEWADKYKGQFDDGWDALRERTFKRQKELGWIPADTKLTPRAETMAAWDSIPEAERPFQRRLMEVFAGFVEHVDAQAGKVIDELDRLGIRDNTIVFYILGDNGSSAEGQNGSISELLAQNQIPEHRPAADRGAEQARRPGCARRAEGGQHVSRRLGVGGRHAVPLHQADRLAFRRHAQPDGDLLAGAHQAGQDAALAVPPRQRHRADDLRDPRHQAAQGRGRLRAGPDRRRQHGLYVRRRQGARTQAHPVFRQQRQPRHLSRRLVCLHLRPADAVAHGKSRDWRHGIRARTSGSFTTSRPTFRRPTTLRRRNRSGSKS